jgi:nucleoside-diphosphate-sugar epimerase
MRVLVTGLEGYIGSLLGPLLMSQGHEVVGLDTGYYREGWLYSDPSRRNQPQLLNQDLRLIGPDQLEGFDAVAHLAELSNDPLAANNVEITYAINHLGSVRLAESAKAAGVKRFVYTSSCSVYGLGDGSFLTERDAVNPQTAYARCKLLVERDVGALASDDFSPIFLRNATAFGASPRMRFDIVLNNLCGWAWTTRRIAMTSDGTPWRPLVHALDICSAVACSLTAPQEAIHGEIFNVGDNAGNYSIRQIAEIVAGEFPGCELEIGSSAGDNRSYRASFDKIHEHLPAFKCEWNAQSGARQLRQLFERIDMTSQIFEFRAFTRLKEIEYLLETGQIDDRFFWTQLQPTENRAVE